MRAKVFRKPCYFAESVYLLTAYMNHISFEDEYRRIRKKYGLSLYPEVKSDLERVRELERLSVMATEGLDPEDKRLRYYFDVLSGAEEIGCCLAQVMLLSVPIDYADIDAFADKLISVFHTMFGEGVRINDLNGMGLVLERWDSQEEREPLAAQVERLPCSMEAKWQILLALSDFDRHIRELTELIRPVAQRLYGALEPIAAMNEGVLAQWSEYFETHTVEDFQNEMFNTSFLFTEDDIPNELWLGIWYFNMFGAWSEWMGTRPNLVRIAYIGMCIDFDYSAKQKKRPDAETLCSLARALGSKDKLEILRRCSEGPMTAARLAEAMNVNSGTVSRNLYSLFKQGYLDTKGDGERVNYVTRRDTLEQVFQWILDYISHVSKIEP